MRIAIRQAQRRIGSSPGEDLLGSTWVGDQLTEELCAGGSDDRSCLVRSGGHSNHCGNALEGFYVHCDQPLAACERYGPTGSVEEARADVPDCFDEIRRGS